MHCFLLESVLQLLNLRESSFLATNRQTVLTTPTNRDKVEPLTHERKDMKLVEMLAREISVWPEGADYAIQSNLTKMVFFVWDTNSDDSFDFELQSKASDYVTAEVTRAQWEAERARIAANQQATQEAQEIARTGSMTSEEQELVDIACGKRSKEDQEQIKEVTSYVSVGYMLERDYEAEEAKQYDQELWDKVAMGSLQTYLNLCELSGAREDFVEKAASMADAFMAERAKRMKG